MADFGDEECDAEDLLLQRHKKEKKDLQAEIQKLKHSVTKGDKKKKKEVTEKIALLESDLNAKHKKELAEFEENKSNETNAVNADVEAVQESVEKMTVEEPDEAGDVVKPAGKPKKQSKAQKRRDKKAAQDLEREERIREQEIENLTSSRHMEAVKIASVLTQRGLQIHEIPSDGNCLYAAVIHQLEERKISNTVDSLRKQVAEYMREHADDFLPFLSKDNGDCYTQDDFEEYCKLLETTPAWGGQLEIQALCNVLHTPVEVVQAEGPSLVTGEQYDGSPLVLTYYRHAYGLGEHYHSVEQKVENPEDDFT
ncbi:deubiquitinase OTUD6B-like [Mercenaria mercenaria]|uniref:deubiquitinase OTUD6B-like n=1 Tax=Mercenaria mercenaria TaxID=6596 RepID=UPI00234EB527|nr:deubiquitinase OTUD6B-like [Mercenaria mercenaria]